MRMEQELSSSPFLSSKFLYLFFCSYLVEKICKYPYNQKLLILYNLIDETDPSEFPLADTQILLFLSTQTSLRNNFLC